MLVFAATGRAEDTTVAADAGATTVANDTGSVAATPTADGSSATPPAATPDPTPSTSDSGEVSDASGTTDPGTPPDTGTTGDPGATVPDGPADGGLSGDPSTPTPDTAGGGSVPGDSPGSTSDPGPITPTDPAPPLPGDPVPPVDAPIGPEPGQAQTTAPSGSPHVSSDVPGGLSPDGFPTGGSIPVSDALVAVVFGNPRTSALPVNDPSGRSSGVTTTAPGHSRGSPGKPSLPSDSPGPSAPASAPAGSGGAPGGGFFFSAFAALVAAVCFGLAGRSTKRLITSVAAWEPVAFASLPERPG